MPVNLSWPHVTKFHPLPEARAERVLNLIFGKNMWPQFAMFALVSEFRQAEHDALDRTREVEK